MNDYLKNNFKILKNKVLNLNNQIKIFNICYGLVNNFSTVIMTKI